MSLPSVITADYNSDHKSFMFTIASNDTIHLTDPSLKYRLMYKKTKWKKFEKTLNNSYENNIPFDGNLTDDEIDSHIGKIDTVLLATIETFVPKYEPQNNTLNYTTTKMKKLHKYKSYLISTLKKALKKHFVNAHSILNIDHIKLLLNETNRLLNAEYRIAYTKYWDSQIKFINHTKPEKFFPKINRFFRPKAQFQIKSLSVSTGRISLLNRSNCDLTKILRQDNNYIIHLPIDILNVIGSYFETVNAPRSLNHNTPLKRTVDEKARSLVNSFQKKQIITSLSLPALLLTPPTTQYRQRIA